MATGHGLWNDYRFRVKRRNLLWWAFRSRHQLTTIHDRAGDLAPDTILAFATIRNEMVRLPFFLEHYRKLGVDHFLIVDNGSDDGTVEYLSDQPDVSLWQTKASYRQARFGMNWLGWLLMHYGHGHWCLTLDADEILVFPHMAQRTLGDLTAWLDREGAEVFGVMMLDLYPRDRVGSVQYVPGTDPSNVLNWFDPDNYTWENLPRFRNISIRGGVRKRMFFKDKPDLSPHLHKTPLVRWNRRYVYASSTHVLLPRHLNGALDARKALPTGVFLHNKFLRQVLEKSEEEKLRREHFTHSEQYEAYYDDVIEDPILWSKKSLRYEGVGQLEALGLMTSGNWN